MKNTDTALDTFARLQDDLMMRLMAGIPPRKLERSRQKHLAALVAAGFKLSEAIHAWDDSVNTAQYMREQEKAA